MRPAVVVVAKECRPGQVKTRLVPAVGAAGAARLAQASLLDTLDAVDALAATHPGGVRRVLFLQGSPPGDAELDGWEVLAQGGGDLDERLADLLDRVPGPLALVGMDTPQLQPDDLAPALALDGRQAWLGPAADGGFWALAVAELAGEAGPAGPLRRRGDLVRGVPMSRDDTGAHQLARLRGAGLRVGLLGELRDVDTADDVDAVAALAPRTRTARVWAELRAGGGTT